MPERVYGRPPAPATPATMLTLVRHGQTTGNVARLLSGFSDDPLTPFGRQQAAAMGTAFADLVRAGTLPPVGTLYVSPLQRAMDTAAQIAEPLGLTPVVRDDLKEINFGDVERMTVEDATTRFPQLMGAFENTTESLHFGFPNGETRMEFQARSRDALASIVAAHPGEHVVVVAHGGVLGIALAHFLAGDTRRWRDYMLHNCSISRLTVQETAVTLHAVNDIAHLADLTPEEADATAEIEAVQDFDPATAARTAAGHH